MKKILITASMALFFVGASHFADACSGTIYSGDVQGAIDDFNANCSAGDVMKIIDVNTGAETIVSLPLE